MSTDIILMSRSLPLHQAGGMEFVAWDLAREFTKLGLRVRIVTSTLPHDRGEFTQDGVIVTPLAGTVPGKYSKSWWRASQRYLSPDRIDSSWAVLSVSAAACSAVRSRPEDSVTPFVLQLHGTSWGEAVSKWKSGSPLNIIRSVANLRWVPKELLEYKLFDSVVAVGSGTLRALHSPPMSWFLDSHKIHLINNGIDTNLFRPETASRASLRQSLGLPEHAPVVIAANRLHPKKGTQLSMRAFAIAARKIPSAILLVAGDGPELKNLKNASIQLDIQNHVRFLGSLPRQELAKFLQSADAFLFLTEFTEVGLTLNLMEALASGLPCVISSHLHVADFPSIWRVDPRDSQHGARVLLDILHGATTSERINHLSAGLSLTYSAQMYLNLMQTLRNRRIQRIGTTPKGKSSS